MLTADQRDRLNTLATRLVDQEAARVIVEPQDRSEGFWFGGGNLVAGPDGALFLCGRYRNHGDSRLGTGAGTRGLELAIFRSDNQGESFEKVASWSKSDLALLASTGGPGKQGSERPIVSIEGVALRYGADGFELFVSTEKDTIGYPAEVHDFLKPGAGVWSIDRLHGSTIDDLKQSPIEPLLWSDNPAHLHIKDPFIYEPGDGSLQLLFCSHPFSWTSSNTGYATRPAGSNSFSKPIQSCFGRGTCWDVAMSRGTSLVDLPGVGPFADTKATLLFYDGGECVRNLDEHTASVRRPRGYSCEELGGLAVLQDDDWQSAQRLSINLPLFISPYGTGCSRYVDVLATAEFWYITWQQSQSDCSQPLVMNRVPTDDVIRILS